MPIISYLVSILLLSFSDYVVADLENPSIDQDPDFYSQPGFSDSRQYHVTENLMIDTYSGTLQIHSSDLVVPGVGKEIVIQRSYNSAPSPISEYSYMGPGWDIHFGRILGIYTCSEGEFVQKSVRLFYIKPDGAMVPIVLGNTLYVDIDSDSELDPEIDYVPEIITSEYWRGECRDNQLVLTDLDNTDYYMGSSSGENTARFVVSRIEDGYGSGFNIEYQDFNGFLRPEMVSADDGRVVNFNYTGTRLSSVSDGVVSIFYHYKSSGHLEAVEFPEDHLWGFEYKESTRLLSKVVTPLKLEIDLTWENYLFKEKDYPVIKSKCSDSQGCWYYSYLREYEESVGSFEFLDVTTIETPYSTVEKYYHASPLTFASKNYIWSIGLLIRKEIYSDLGGQAGGLLHCSVELGATSSLLLSENYEWFGKRYSTDLRVYKNIGVDLIEQFLRPFIEKFVSNIDGAVYEYKVVSRSGWGFPEVEKEKGTSQRYKKTLYTTSDGGEWYHKPYEKMIASYDVDELYQSVFYELQTSKGSLAFKNDKGLGLNFKYYSDGQLQEIKDEFGNVTSFSNYYRGVPRRVDFSDGGYITRTVDERGRVTSEINQKQNKTAYHYDGLDRVVKVDVPLTDDVIIDYTYNPSSIYGQLRKFQKGNLIEFFYDDQFGNLSKHVRKDLVSGEELSKYYQYDTRNLLAFESYVNEPANGIKYNYDLLGRVQSSSTTNNESMFYDYKSNKTSVYDPECNVTTRYYDTYSYDQRYISKIEGPEGLLIDIERDFQGRPLTVSQNGIVRNYSYYNHHFSHLLQYYKDSESSVEHYYSYDSGGRLETETVGIIGTYLGHTIEYGYDGMNRVETIAYSDRVQTYKYPWELFVPEICVEENCDYVTYSDSYHIDYDLLGNVEKRSKVTIIDSTLSGMSQSETSWEYGFDEENRLLSEALLHNGVSYDIGYEYDFSLGYLSEMQYPNGLTVQYAPDSFGRPTKVSPIVSLVQYHDQGFLKSIDFSNGMKVDYSLNSRKLPEKVQAFSFGKNVDLEYKYDLNGNVTDVTDHLFQNKSKKMKYDGLDRLVEADGVWGNIVYEYDELSNLARKELGDDVVNFHYDVETNQLTHVDDIYLLYDIYGRVINDGKNQYYYDFSDNLVQARNGFQNNQLSYDYDSNNRMVLRESSRLLATYSDLKTAEVVHETVEIGQDRFVYSSDGRMLYEEKNFADLVRSHIYLGTKLVGFLDDRVDCLDDSDGDNIPHCYERENNLNINLNDADQDRDKDGLSNLEEYLIGTKADWTDSDGDLIDDGSEQVNGLNPLDIVDAQLDPDGDAFSNLEEILIGSDPFQYSPFSKPEKFFVSYDGANSVVLNWMKKEHVDGYEVFWSTEPLNDLSSAKMIFIEEPPFVHAIDKSAEHYFYAVSARKNSRLSEPTDIKTAHISKKQWHYVGYLSESHPTDDLAVDGFGNVFILLESVSKLQNVDVAIYDFSEGVLSEYNLFDGWSPKYEDMSVAESGYAAVFGSLHQKAQIDIYDPQDNVWNRLALPLLQGHYYESLRVESSASGDFVFFWVERSINSPFVYTPKFKIWNASTGWEDTVIALVDDVKSDFLGIPFIYIYSQLYLGINEAGNVYSVRKALDSEGDSVLLASTFSKSSGVDLKVLGKVADGAKSIRASCIDFESCIFVWEQENTLFGSRYSGGDLGESMEIASLGESKQFVGAYLLKEGTSFVLVRGDSEVQWKMEVTYQLPEQGWTQLTPLEGTDFADFEKGKFNAMLDGSLRLAFNEEWAAVYPDESLFYHLHPDGGVQVEISESINNAVLPALYTGIEFLSAPNIGGVAARRDHYDICCYLVNQPIYMYLANPLTVNQMPLADIGVEVFQQNALALNGINSDLTFLSSKLVFNESSHFKLINQSVDSDGFIIDYKISQVSGPPIEALGAEKGYIKFLSSEEAVYEFVISVTDERGGTDTESFVVSVISDPYDFEYLDLSQSIAHSSQDNESAGSVNSTTDSITLVGNRWRYIDGASVTITENTILEFDFSSDGLGEIQGVGFDNDSTVNNGETVFNLIGSQNWGVTNYVYTGNGSTQKFTIPVGQFLTGEWKFLIVNDNDGNQSQSTVTVSNVRLCEFSCAGVPPSSDSVPIDLSQTSSYGGQDSDSGLVQSSATSISLHGNRWRYVENAKVMISEDTVISLEFSSDGLGEIQGIGFDNDSTVNTGEAIFNLVGSQSWGIQDYQYTGNGNIQKFSIPIGQYLTGEWQLVIVNDSDEAPDDSTLTVSNVYICEVSCEGEGQ